MHSYLRAVGFSNIKNRPELDRILGLVMEQPMEKYVTQMDENIVLSEISKDFAERIGITIRGEYDEKGFFHLEHYFPHFRGQEISVKEEVVINKRVDSDSYTGMCDDLRLGVSLIFYLQNAIDYIDNKKEKGEISPVTPIVLSALSTEGIILLPLAVKDGKPANTAKDDSSRNQLIAEAKKGNQEAIDSLTIDDIDLYAMVSRRIKMEDLYSIVDNSFVPYGSESDNYSIIGTIKDFHQVENSMTKEQIYDLSISCNDIFFHVCINEKDLQGEPLVGRRFKGNIWMQGFVNLDS